VWTSEQVTLMGAILLTQTAASVLVTGRIRQVRLEDGRAPATMAPATIMAAVRDGPACHRADRASREEVCHTPAAPHVTPIALAAPIAAGTRIEIVTGLAGEPGSGAGMQTHIVDRAETGYTAIRIAVPVVATVSALSIGSLV